MKEKSMTRLTSAVGESTYRIAQNFGIYFGGLVDLRAIHEHFICRKTSLCDVLIIAKSYFMLGLQLDVPV